MCVCLKTRYYYYYYLCGNGRGFCILHNLHVLATGTIACERARNNGLRRGHRAKEAASPEESEEESAGDRSANRARRTFAGAVEDAARAFHVTSPLLLQKRTPRYIRIHFHRALVYHFPLGFTEPPSSKTYTSAIICVIISIIIIIKYFQRALGIIVYRNVIMAPRIIKYII